MWAADANQQGYVKEAPAVCDALGSCLNDPCLKTQDLASLALPDQAQVSAADAAAGSQAPASPAAAERQHWADETILKGHVGM